MAKRKAESDLDEGARREPKQRAVYGPFKRIQKPTKDVRENNSSEKRTRRVDQPIVIDLTGPDTLDAATDQGDEVHGSHGSASQSRSGIRPVSNLNPAPGPSFITGRRRGERTGGPAQGIAGRHRQSRTGRTSAKKSNARGGNGTRVVVNTQIQQNLSSMIPRATVASESQHTAQAPPSVSRDRTKPRGQESREYADLSTDGPLVYVDVTEDEARELVDLPPKKKGYVDLLDRDHHPSTQVRPAQTNDTGGHSTAGRSDPVQATADSLDLDSLRNNVAFQQLRENVRNQRQTLEAALENPQLLQLGWEFPEETRRLLTEPRGEVSKRID
ncbi:hypothetical protein M409DRAFT_26782 [Zasmidium cellare ATCC 36951]|uniref:Uncharacterized protein n=1 Tax=Zasmidium cellare ATCC 36951 TaxID=1080233 RepID=A0A6A6CB97_ZASCE|nr:uncharacterized protein M409DRAFT_26782 [Zasmidium cellare ATCC 36951]KAF2162929.1 hypothetical protein M409DRAFT_26782 [Zasmidium cellare ATCC 36951]